MSNLLPLDIYLLPFFEGCFFEVFLAVIFNFCQFFYFFFHSFFFLSFHSRFVAQCFFLHRKCCKAPLRLCVDFRFLLKFSSFTLLKGRQTLLLNSQSVKAAKNTVDF